MSWKKLTEENVIANLTRRELDLHRNEFEVDVVREILVETVDLVRGSIESGRKCRLSPEAGTIPAMLVSPSIDYAIFSLLKRINVVPNEARTKAYDKATSLFDRIAAGQITPPDGVETTPEPPVRDPARPAITRKKRLLGRHQENGI